MEKLKLIMLSLLVVCSFQASAQFGYYQDALRYSQTNWLTGSTARMQGLAGAQASLGGDMSLANSNPAGLGFFNKSTASMTLGLGFENSDDEFTDLTTPNFKNTFAVSNAGFVVNYGKGRFTEEKFKGGSLGISLARVNDFSREFRYEGESGTSLLDVIVDNYNSGNSGDLEEAFYNQFLVDQVAYDGVLDVYDPNNFLVNAGVISPNQVGMFADYASPIITIPYQQESISEKGNQYQFNLSWGGNYDDKVYFGGGIGVQTLYFKRKRNYEENEFIDGNGNDDPLIDSFVLEDQLVARGGGLNTSFGMIVRPVQMLTIGIAYQSPTFLTINEESDFTLTSNWRNVSYEDLNGDGTVYDLGGGVDPYLSQITETKYKIRTPSKLNLGTTIFLGKLGFISGDLEMVDYSNAELQSNDFSPLGDNQVILNDYKSVLNYRVGAEFRLDEIRLRGGLAVYPDPTGQGNKKDYFTFGVGYRASDYFVDLALVNSKYQQAYQPYSYPDADLVVSSDIRTTRIAITAGFNY